MRPFSIAIFILSFSIGLAAFADCFEEAKKAIQDEIINEHEFHEFIVPSVSLLCKEAARIQDLNKPYNDSDSLTDLFSTLGSISEFITGKESGAFQILQPYCRTETEYFCRFCMATDIHSALTVMKSPELMKALPQSIQILGQKLAEIPMNEKIELSSLLLPLFADQENEAIKAMLLGTFIGLDDNGVQFSRLMADLLYVKDYSSFAKIFAAFLQIPGGRIQNQRDVQ